MTGMQIRGVLLIACVLACNAFAPAQSTVHSRNHIAQEDIPIRRLPRVLRMGSNAGEIHSSSHHQGAASESGTLHSEHESDFLIESFEGLAAEEIPISTETLADAWRVAATSNPRMQAMMHQRASAAHRWRAELARRLPTLAIEGGYRLSSDDLAIQYPSGTSLGNLLIRFAEDQGATARVGVDWTVYDHQMAFLIGSAKDAEHAASYEEMVAHQDLKLAVASSYVQILQARAELATAVECVRNREEYQRTVTDNRLVTDNQRTAAKTTTIEFREDMKSAERTLHLNQVEYNLLLGRPSDFPFDIVDIQTPTIPKHPIANLVQRALCNRLELQQLGMQQRSIAQKANAVAAGRLPRASMIGDFIYNENRFVTPDGLGNLAMVVSWNFFDSGRTRQQEAATAARARALRSHANDLELQITKEIHTLDARTEFSRSAIIKADAVLRRAASASDEAKVLRDSKADGEQAFLDAELALLKSRLSLDKARYNHAILLFELRRGLGEI